MDSFYPHTALPAFVPLVGPIIASPLINLIALIDLAVSKIFSCTQKLTQEEQRKLDKHVNRLHTVLRFHAINTFTLGIFYWRDLIKNECCKS